MKGCNLYCAICNWFVFRYKALDRIDQDRKLMLFQHLGFVHCPIREHCPAFPNCMDALIERILRTRAHRYIVNNECCTGSTHIKLGLCFSKLEHSVQQQRMEQQQVLSQ